jgi:hypothetical protein
VTAQPRRRPPRRRPDPERVGEPMPTLPTTRTRPKGRAPYRARRGSDADRALRAAVEVVDEYRAQDRLPLGPREVGYVCTRRGFTKDDIVTIEHALVRARRAGLVAWDAISDGRTSDAGPWVPDSPASAAEVMLDDLATAQADRQRGQPYRVEVWTEAAAWLPRLERLCSPRGVRVYSGSGSVPVTATRAAALRALDALAERRQPTVLLTVGDLDLHGLRNIAVPFAQDVLAFTADGLADACEGDEYRDLAPDLVHVRRLGITADQAAALPPEALGEPTAAALRAGWPWPFTAQAEALLPEDRDALVADAIDRLHDLDVRAAAVEAEEALHRATRVALRDRLDGS